MNNTDRKIRLIIGKIGFDPHDRAVLALSTVFRGAGMEVIFLGKFKTAEEVVRAAIDEDVDVIALSDHCGTMRVIATDVVELLKKYDATDICVVAGGVIENADKPILEEMGVTGNYCLGTPFDEIVNHIQNRVHTERWQRS